MGPPVTLITGTRKGIGLALAQYYVRRGHRVIGCSRQGVDWTAEGYTHYPLDVADEVSVKGLFADIRRTCGRLDHLINNAAVAAMNHSLLTPLSTVESVLSTNVTGTFLFCREAAKLMKRQGQGRIVNFTTVAVPLRLEGEAVYTASKAAVLSLTQVLARELATFGITVNSIGPTPVRTDLIRAVPEEKLRRLLQRQAIVRLATINDITNVIDFYLRDESGFITGQNLFLGGVS